MTLFETVTQLREQGMTWNEISHEVQDVREFFSGENLRLWYRHERTRLRDRIEAGVDLPPALPQPFEEALQVRLSPDKGVLVLADVHVPYHHENFITDAVDKALSNRNLGMIILAGDLFTFDQISKYSKTHNMPRMETELEIGGSMLLYLANLAPVYITNSNHDARFANKVDTQFSLQRLMNAALNGRKPRHDIITTERDYLFLGDSYVIGHLSRGSSVAGKIAYNIAQKYHRHCFAGHDHITGVQGSTSRHIGASIGCSADFEKFWYSERLMTPTQFMQRGFAFIDGDKGFKLYRESNRPYYERVNYADGTYSSLIHSDA